MASSSEASTRTGRYIAQLTGYRAFMPAPPQPAVALTGELQALLSAADRALGRARWVGADAAEPGPLRLHVRAQGGGALQPDRGTQSSLQELLAADYCRAESRVSPVHRRRLNPRNNATCRRAPAKTRQPRQGCSNHAVGLRDKIRQPASGGALGCNRYRPLANCLLTGFLNDFLNDGE